MRSAHLAAAAFALLAGGGLAAMFGVQPTAEPPEPGNRALATQARARADRLDSAARAATLASERALQQEAALARQVIAGEAKLADADAKLRALRTRRTAIARRLARERLPATQLAAALAVRARQPVLLDLLRPGSLADAVHLRAVTAAITPQIAQRTRRVRVQLDEARRLERIAARLVAERNAEQAALTTRRTQLAALSAGERLKASRAGGAADREAERALVIAQRAHGLPGLVGELAMSENGRALPAQPGGPAPYRLPARGAVTANAQSEGSLIIRPGPGALVVSPAAGRIAFAAPYRGFGTIVIVEHAGGWLSLITGLASAQVQPGRAVVAGSPIGHAPPIAPQIGLELRRGSERVPVRRYLR